MWASCHPIVIIELSVQHFVKADSKDSSDYRPCERGIEKNMPASTKEQNGKQPVLHIFQTTDRTSCPNGEKSIG